jgi:riboflavin kinase / FMN adenylyltransferase
MTDERAAGRPRGPRAPRPLPPTPYDDQDVVLHRTLAGIERHGTVIALGNFDGVHLGHRALLGRARERADELGVPLVAVSFFPPAKVLFGDARFLSSESEKAALLTEAGAAEVVVIPFDRAFAATPPEAFADAVAAARPAVVVVGEDFRFGRERSGGLDLLRATLPHIEVVPLELTAGEVTKSSLIRAALAAADVERAEQMLGLPYRVTGLVVRGDQRGRTIGFPTLNVATDPRKALPIGVFAVVVDTPAGRCDGVANVGPRPTFPDGAPALEAHLLDTDLDLYDRRVTVHLLQHLRAPRRFDGLDALRAQLAVDAAGARLAIASRRLAPDRREPQADGHDPPRGRQA